VDGWTTDADNYIKIWTDPDDPYGRHKGKWDTAYYHINGDRNSWGAIDIREEYVTVDGLQIESTGNLNESSGGIHAYPDSTTLSAIRLSNNIIKANGSGTPDGAAGIGGDSSWDGNWYIWNNIIFGGWHDGIHISYLDDAYDLFIYNNTVLDNDRYGIDNGGGNGPATINIYNNISNGNGIDYNLENVDSSASNIAEDDSSPNNAFDRIIVPFISPSTGDYHVPITATTTRKTGTNAVSSLFTTDIDGETRTGDYDIGADETLKPVEAMLRSVRIMARPRLYLV